jgi:multiple sugar transport system ATP-binding protein
LSIPLAAATASRLRLPASAGREGVTLGIRPEHIALGSGSKRASGPSHEVTVDVVEPIGNETVVYVRDGDMQFCVRRNEAVSVKPGQKISIRFDAKRMLFFDTKTEKRLA